MKFIPCGQGIVNDPVSGSPLTTEVVEQVGFGRIGEYLDWTGEGYAFRLLLAAPELLKAAQDLSAWADHMGGWEAECWERLRDAIAKAEGE